MALTDLELHEWDANNKRDRLTGCSITGFEDAMAFVDNDGRREILKGLRQAAHETISAYADWLRVTVPLIITSNKPEGSQSLVFGGVSPGVHNAHSPYHIRRIRISADDALAQVAKELGWVIHPEIGTPENKIENARTLVIDFPIKSNAVRTKDDVSALEQLDRYFMFQECYTDHNTSNTITVRKDEWAAVEDKIKSRWDDFIGVSFLAHDGGTYQLAPYEAITKEQYEMLAANMKPFDHEVLAKYERDEEHVLDDHDPNCGTGACPVR